MAGRRWPVFIASLASTGCTLLVSTSGLVGDGPAPAPDAADAPATDGPPVEAAADAPIDVAEAGPKSPCTGTHLFCDDFDRSSAPQSGWSNLNLTAKGALSLSPSRAVTAPNALFTNLPRRSETDDAEYAVLRHVLRRSFTKATIAFDVFIQRPAFTNGDINMGVGCFYARQDNTRGHTCVSVGADYTVVFGAQLGPWPWDTWVHVVLTMPTDGAPTASITSSTLGNKTVSGNYELNVDVGEPDIQLEIGLMSYNRPAPSFTVYYDNVVVDAE